MLATRKLLVSIHSHALVSPEAVIGKDVHVGPFATIEAGVVIGDGCRIEARATIKSGVMLGEQNLIGEGAVLGGAPQHLSPPEQIGGLVIGDRNVIRENATLHRAMHADADTRIGNECLLMVGAHVAHDCVVKDHVVLTNNVMLAGHVQVDERAYLGGGVAVHQFCRVGRIAMIGGMARIIQDVPPYVMVDGDSANVVGLNRVGLRRAGLLIDEIRGIKEAYQVIYRSGLSFEERMETLAEQFATGAAAEFEPFFRGGSRGFVRERRAAPVAATLRIHEASKPKTVANLPDGVKKAG